MPDSPLLWDRLAARCYLSERYTKKVMYARFFGGMIDPWLHHILDEELQALQRCDADEREVA